MGVCMSSREPKAGKQSPELVVRKKAEDQQPWTDQIKMLLLGPGESGKSTILKQMRILRLGLTTADLLGYQTVVRTNVIDGMNQLLVGMTLLGMKLHSDHLRDKAELIHKLERTELEKVLSEKVWEAIRMLWADKTIQECYSRRNEFQLDDSAKYFFDNVDRIAKAQYIPTEQDVLQIRAPTLGIIEMNFRYKKNYFRVIDVGGQKSQRKKWIHQFECVNVIIFVIAISDYDKAMREDWSTNRLTDSMELFSDISNSLWFKDTEITLFLNKVDLFKQKIFSTPITGIFPNYHGPQTYEDSVKYIGDQMKAQNRNPSRVINVHETCATDKNQVQTIISDVIDIVVESYMRKRGIIS